MLIDVICSLGSDAGGRVLEDTTASSSLPGRHRLWVCTQVELGTVLEKLAADQMPFAPQRHSTPVLRDSSGTELALLASLHPSVMPGIRPGPVGLEPVHRPLPSPAGEGSLLCLARQGSFPAPFAVWCPGKQTACEVTALLC